MRVILWMLVFTGFWWAILGLQKSTKEVNLNKQIKIQTTIDSLQSHIDSLYRIIYTIDTVEVIEEDGIRWYTLDTLLSAIMFIESSYNDSAYHAGEDAVGCLQIRKCMVDDVNRILKRQKLTLSFTYNDRWSRDKSTQMFEIYCKHYNLTTNEEVARCWNGGPRGINNPATVGYWNKVKDKINS
tara:strand:- start:116 stop:667 length:552 start_codon:yes stop_codon:yes gene_type:complete